MKNENTADQKKTDLRAEKKKSRPAEQKKPAGTGEPKKSSAGGAKKNTPRKDRRSDYDDSLYKMLQQKKEEQIKAKKKRQEILLTAAMALVTVVIVAAIIMSMRGRVPADVPGSYTDNPDIVARITVPDTEMDFPVVWSEDLNYYLNHNVMGKESASGSIILEHGNKPDFSDLNTIIYGFAPQRGGMFADLKEYKSPAYYVAHPIIEIEVGGESISYEVFSCYEAYDDTYAIGFAADDVYAAYLDVCASRSLYETNAEVTAEDRILTLSTLSRSGEARFIVQAKRLEQE